MPVVSQRWWVVGLAALCVVTASPAAIASPAGGRQRDAAEEERYVRELRAIDPALVATFREGTEALDAQRFSEARAAFEKVALAAPDHPATLRRLSYVLHETGEIDRAIAVARNARRVGPGALGDYALASALVAKRGSPAAMAEAGELADHMLDGTPTEEAATMAATIAAERQDGATLGRAVAVLERVAPASVATGYLGAIYYAGQGNLDAAEQALARAEAAGLPAQAAEQLRKGTGIWRRRMLGRLGRVSLIAVGAWIFGLLLILVAGRVMSGLALRAVERFAPVRSDALLVQTGRLRRAYAAAIGFAAVYYFASIPIVIALVLGLSSLAVYAMLSFGWIPIKLLVLVVLGALMSVWALARSIFVRRAKEQDPGPRLGVEQAPRLWSLLRDVAAQVGTRPVDDVYLTPGTEVAVAERGTMRQRLRDRGRRFLILGVGVLDGLSTQQLRAVLAHEYGHFSHRDTAGGDVAATVRASLFAAIVRLAQSGGASVLNPAWHFLRLFFALFQRITLGASRLQEVLADRFAATAYGAPALIGGLEHVVRRTIEFEARSEVVISRAQQQRQAIASLYVAPPDGAINAVDVATALAKAMSDPGSPYDSHPPVARRIAWLSALGATAVHGDSASAVGTEEMAWALFADRAAVEADMTALVNQRLDQAGHIDRPVPPAMMSPLGTPGA